MRLGQVLLRSADQHEHACEHGQWSRCGAGKNPIILRAHQVSPETPGAAVQIVSVINYKGGVGKTTLTANLGAEIARRGKRVLLIDLDPQASLTFSFFSESSWSHKLAEHQTIKEWYDTDDTPTPAKLAALVCTPERVNLALRERQGRLDLIASHLELINIDLDLAAELGGGSWKSKKSNYLKIHRRLADGLSDSELASYDLVLIDCAPNFNITTKTALVASDHVLVPSKADHLSTLGIRYLIRKIRELVNDYNGCAKDQYGDDATFIDEPSLAVVFTMIQYWRGPISAQLPYIERTVKLGIPTFSTKVRENKTLFGPAPEEGIPAILSDRGDPDHIRELDELTDEFQAWLRRKT
jgi:chromosome partitioning protein